MKLVLKPPASHLVPSTFHSHAIPPPHLPAARHLKVPASFIKAKRQLNQLGLAVPNVLSADRALWWQYVIETVEWDLERERVVIDLADGTRESWPLNDIGNDPGETVPAPDDDRLERDIDHIDRRVPTPSSSSSSFEPRWSPTSVSRQLCALSIELRSAYEDLTMISILGGTAPRFDQEQDFALLLRLSAEPSAEVPLTWDPSHSVVAHVAGIHGSDENGVSIERDVGTEGTAPEAQPLRGRFESRRRPTRLSRAPDDERRSGASLHHDYLSLVALLSRIRTYLADLLPATIYPRLKPRIGPSFALWHANSAASWCRRRAIETGGQVGLMILDLLDDAPEGLVEFATSPEPDLKADASRPGSSDIVIRSEVEEEGTWGIQVGGDRVWQEFFETGEKHRDNPLETMRDDFELRCWAEDAIERQRAFEREEWQRRPENPKWLQRPEPWEVSIPFDRDGFNGPGWASPITTHHGVDVSSTSFENRRPSPGRSGAEVGGRKPCALVPPPRGLTAGDILVGDFGSSSRSSPSSPISSVSSSDFDVSSSEPDPTAQSDLFRIEDVLGEAFLPRVLPKAVVTPSSSRGSEMEQARSRLHHKLNEIAGFAKKMIELQEFAAAELVQLQDQLEQEQRNKVEYSQSASGLRTPGVSSISPPPTPPRKTTLPLKAQPLLHQSADNVLTGKLARALENLDSCKSGGGHRSRTESTPTTLNADRQRIASVSTAPATKKRKTVASPKPRKRQKLNLLAYDKVAALERGMRRGALNEVGLTKKLTSKSRKGSARRGERDAGSGGEKGTDASAQSSRRKGKPLKREESRVNLERLVVPAIVPESATIGPSARRLSLFELAHRRRPPSAEIVGGPLVSDSRDEGELSVEFDHDGDVLFHSSSPRKFSELADEWDAADVTDEEVEPIDIEIEQIHDHDDRDLKAETSALSDQPLATVDRRLAATVFGSSPSSPPSPRSMPRIFTCTDYPHRRRVGNESKRSSDPAADVPREPTTSPELIPRHPPSDLDRSIRPRLIHRPDFSKSTYQYETTEAAPRPQRGNQGGLVENEDDAVEAKSGPAVPTEWTSENEPKAT